MSKSRDLLELFKKLDNPEAEDLRSKLLQLQSKAMRMIPNSQRQLKVKEEIEAVYKQLKTLGYDSSDLW